MSSRRAVAGGVVPRRRRRHRGPGQLGGRSKRSGLGPAPLAMAPRCSRPAPARAVAGAGAAARARLRPDGPRTTGDGPAATTGPYAVGAVSDRIGLRDGPELTPARRRAAQRGAGVPGARRWPRTAGWCRPRRRARHRRLPGVGWCTRTTSATGRPTRASLRSRWGPATRWGSSTDQSTLRTRVFTMQPSATPILSGTDTQAIRDAILAEDPRADTLPARRPTAGRRPQGRGGHVRGTRDPRQGPAQVPPHRRRARARARPG